MATHSNGILALQLQRQLGLGAYCSAWLLCAKLRRSMVAPAAARSPAWSRLTSRNSLPQQERSRAAVAAATRVRC
jgi:hypothetical protein